MAQIVGTYQQQPPQMFQQPQIQPEQAQAPAPERDPLFEALVKYISATPGPSSTSVQQVQSIIDTHRAQPGGMDYLQSIVNPAPVGEPTLWPQSMPVTGFMWTNMFTFDFNFRGSLSNGIPYAIDGNGSASGLYVPQACPFSKSVLFQYHVSCAYANRADFSWDPQRFNNVSEVSFVVHTYSAFVSQSQYIWTL